MALTVAGFAPQRTAVLRGKGGNRGRRDNGVSPPPRTHLETSEVVEMAVAAPTRWRAPAKRTGKRRAPWAHASKAVPAALEWREASLPVLGRLWATAWLPSILLAAALVALVYLLQTSGIATTGYDIQRLQSERDDWQLRNEQLELELAKRQSLTWIESEATGRLGMVRAEPTALAYVQVGR